MNAERDAALAHVLRQYEVEQFYAREAELLDERRFDDWLALFADDARYWMPIARNLAFDDPQPEFTRERADANWFDEGTSDLRKRVLQIQSGDHWAEEPRSRTTHVTANVRIVDDAAETLTVHSRFVVSQSRHETGVNLFVGKRIDVLRAAGGLQIAHRTIYLDQSVLLAQNLTTFF